jgi:hypothetical protein
LGLLDYDRSEGGALLARLRQQVLACVIAANSVWIVSWLRPTVGKGST